MHVIPFFPNLQQPILYFLFFISSCRNVRYGIKCTYWYEISFPVLRIRSVGPIWRIRSKHYHRGTPPCRGNISMGKNMERGEMQYERKWKNGNNKGAKKGALGVKNRHITKRGKLNFVGMEWGDNYRFQTKIYVDSWITYHIQIRNLP